MRVSALVVCLSVAIGLVATPAGAKPFAYCPNESSNAVSVIDIANNSLVTNAPAGVSPIRVGLTPNGKKVYVANSGSNRVTVMDALTFAQIRAIATGQNPAEVLLSPDGGRVFVPNAVAMTLSVINTTTDTLITNLPASVNCRAIIWVTNSIGSWVYLANQGAANVEVINPTTLQVVKTITTGSGPRRMAVTPNGTKVYVTNYQQGTVSVIDTITQTRIKNIVVVGNPRGVEVRPDGAEVWVTNLISNNVAIISTATDTVTETLTTGKQPWTIVFTSDGTKAYVVNAANNNCSVFDVATRALLRLIPTGKLSFWAAFTDDEKYLYVTNPMDGTVSAIDTANDVNIGDIVTGGSPWVIAIGPGDPPTISSVYPNQIKAGTTVQMDIVGTQFRPNLTPSLVPNLAGVAFSNVVVLSTNEISFTMSLTTNVTQGPVSLQILNHDKTVVVATNAITILPPPPAPPPPPKVMSVTPNPITAGDDTLVTINGSNFQAGASLAVLGNPPELTLEGPLVLNTNTMVVDIIPAANAPAGPYGLIVTNPDGQPGTNSSLFTVAPAPAPTVTTVTPTQVIVGTSVAMALKGTGFLPGVTVTPQPANPGMTVDGVNYINKSNLTVFVTLAANATTGNQGLRATNLDNQSAANASLFTILPAPAPTIDSLDTTQVVAPGTFHITLSGTGFMQGITVLPVPSPAGLQVTNVQIGDPDTLVFDLVVAANVPGGLYGFTVRNLDNQSATANNLLTIVGAAPAPTINNVTPSSMTQGETIAMTISGGNFQTGATVSLFPSNAGVTINNVQVNASTITLSLTASVSASTGAFDVIVTNPDSQSATAGGALTIQALPALTITGCSPTTISRGFTTQLTITGTGFRPDSAVSLVNGGAGVTIVGGTTYINATTLKINVSVSATAAVGFRSVRVTNPGSPAVILNNAFNIVSTPPPPTVTSATPSQVVAGNTTTLTVSGTFFQTGAGATVLGNPALVTASSPVVINSNTLTVAISAAVNATPGTYGLIVSNPTGQSGTNASLFSVVAAPAPTVSSVTPTQMVQGTSAAMALKGTGFFPGVIVTAEPANAGLAINSVTFVNSSNLTVNVTVANNATTGAQGFRATNLDGQFGANANLFTIVTPSSAAPTINNVSPGSAVQGETASVTISGTGFQTGATVAFSPSNPGLTMNNLQVVDSNTITLSVTLAVNAATGALNVTVTNPDTQSATANGAFTVLVLPALSITAVNPQTANRGVTTQFTITGTGFRPDSTVSLPNGGSQVTLVGTTYVNSTTLNISVSVSSTAALGWRSVRVTNPGGAVATFTNAFRVQ